MTRERLKTIFERSGLRINEMASRLGMLPQQLNNVFHTNDVKTGILEKVADILGVPDDVISQALGHAARNSTTAIYIEQSQRKVDEANQRVIDFVLKG